MLLYELDDRHANREETVNHVTVVSVLLSYSVLTGPVVNVAGGVGSGYDGGMDQLIEDVDTILLDTYPPAIIFSRG